jgi:hypothetical protein
MRFKPRDNGIATSVPAVPGAQGKYPAPAPVIKNRMMRFVIFSPPERNVHFYDKYAVPASRKQ